MAEPLKNSFGVDIPRRIADMIRPVYPRFKHDAFVRDALVGYAQLDLMPRGWQIARTLRRYLPDDYEKAVDILVASLDSPLEQTQDNGMAPFLYMPHVFLVAEFGLDHFEASMRAQYELTQRFTAEFSIRPYLQKYPRQTLARLKQWTSDPSVHVRRLVSEGTRPRLPWAPRLREFQKDPKPVLALLERLKDDPELYVRRSVANNLNDIGKDHPEILVATAAKWLKNASEDRRWLVNHALRSAIKRAEPGALAVLGFGAEARVALNDVSITPKRAVAGDAVTIAFSLTNGRKQAQRVLVDFCIHFIKASGRTGAKVFKLKTLNMAPGETVLLKKKVSLAEMTTRKHYPGRHKVDLILNGQTLPLGEFVLTQTRAGRG